MVRLSGRSKLGIRLSDLRWIYLLLPGYRYEPAVEHCLRLVADLDYLLVDGGASVGYWSVLASEDPHHAVVAVEPVDATFDELLRNSERNGTRFQCVRAALHSGERPTVQMAVNPSRHGSSYVVEGSAEVEEDRTLQDVRAVTIDGLVAEADPEGRRPLIFKLDVEGSEIPALEGATKALQAEPLVIYEDHGRDRKDEASRFILAELGLRCYAIESWGSVRRMESLADVRARKGRRNLGFNFFATAAGSRFDRILSAQVED